MAKLIAMYKTPADAKAFDDYYYSTHVPIAKKIPGLKRYEVTNGAIMGPEGGSPFYLIATLSFDTIDELHSALGTPEGAAAAKDLGNFATGGVDLWIYDHKDI